MQATAFLFAALALLAARTQAQVAELDLGMREARLVARGRVAPLADGGAVFEPGFVFKGRAPADRILIRVPRSFGFHFRAPRKAGTWLLFLARTRVGWIPVQRPGLARPWPEGDAAARLDACCRLLAPTEPSARGLAAFAVRAARASPDLAASALRAAARLPSGAAKLGALTRAELRALCFDGTHRSELVAEAARVLTAARDPLAPPLIVEMLVARRCPAEAGMLGRCLRVSLGAAALPVLEASLVAARGAARGDLVRAILATDLPHAHARLRTLRADPALRAILDEALQRGR